MAAQRPRVFVNMASSLDGKINPAAGHRQGPFVMSRYLHDPERMRRLRAAADAIVIGAGNLRADDPDLALDDAERARRRQRGEPEPLRVLVTTRGEGVDPVLSAFDRARGGETVIAHAAAMPEATRKALAPYATLVPLGDRHVDVPRLLEWLATARGVKRVLLEGGGALNAAFFAARAVDEVYLTLVPRVLGGKTAPTVVDGDGFAEDAIPDARLASVEQVGDELFLRYEITWFAAPIA